MNNQIITCRECGIKATKKESKRISDLNKMFAKFNNVKTTYICDECDTKRSTFIAEVPK